MSAGPFKQRIQKKSLQQTIIVFGTSTGGPKALQQVLPVFPADYPVPIVVVQHLPGKFTSSLANRLDSLSAITVKEAEQGEVLKPGSAYIAPGGLQLKINKVGENFLFHLEKMQPKKIHCPSVDDVLFSLAELENVQVFPVIMTGMGADGARGLQVLKKKHPSTYAVSESQSTATIYGMPQAALNTGCIDKVADLDSISSLLIDYVN